MRARWFLAGWCCAWLLHLLGTDPAVVRRNLAWWADLAGLASRG